MSHDLLWNGKPLKTDDSAKAVTSHFSDALHWMIQGRAFGKTAGLYGFEMPFEPITIDYDDVKLKMLSGGKTE